MEGIGCLRILLLLNLRVHLFQTSTSPCDLSCRFRECHVRDEGIRERRVMDTGRERASEREGEREKGGGEKVPGGARGPLGLKHKHQHTIFKPFNQRCFLRGLGRRTPVFYSGVLIKLVSS